MKQCSVDLRGQDHMKPIWIVDDDQSIRFVLEKALLREDLPTRSFTNPREVLQALESGDDEDGPQILVSDIRMPGGSGLDLLTKVKEKHPGLPVIIMTAFSDLDSAVSRLPGRRLRVPAQALRPAQGDRADPPRGRGKPARGGGRRTHGGGARNAGPGAGDAGRVPRHRPPVAKQRDGDDHRRVGLGQGAGGARLAQAFARARRALRGDQHRRHPEGPAGVRAVRPRARRLHRRADHAARALRAGRGRHAVPRRNRRHAVRPADAPLARAVGRRISIASAATTPSRPTCA